MSALPNVEPGAVHRVPELVAARGASKVLLVCGRRSFEASGAASMLPALERVAQVERWSDFRPNTDVEDLRVGLQVVADLQPDVVVAVGGGSAMDMAKLLVSYEGLEPEQVDDAIRAGERIEDRSTGLILVPTTSGSGSEATHFAVVYIGLDKHSIAGPAMHADEIVLDPDLSLSGTPHQRATSGIDAIAQAIESLWATGADDHSRADADRALSLLLPAIASYVNDSTPAPQVAHDMTLGAHLAGRAIDVSRTTGAHALSYGLTKRFGLPHGHAVGVTLGAFVDAHASAGAEQLQTAVDPECHARVMGQILDHLEVDGQGAAKRRVDELLVSVGLTPGLQAHGVDDAARRELARSVNVERLGNNPVVFDQPGLEELLVNCG